MQTSKLIKWVSKLLQPPLTARGKLSLAPKTTVPTLEPARIAAIMGTVEEGLEEAEHTVEQITSAVNGVVVSMIKREKEGSSL